MRLHAIITATRTKYMLFFIANPFSIAASNSLLSTQTSRSTLCQLLQACSIQFSFSCVFRTTILSDERSYLNFFMSIIDDRDQITFAILFSQKYSLCCAFYRAFSAIANQVAGAGTNSCRLTGLR